MNGSEQADFKAIIVQIYQSISQEVTKLNNNVSAKKEEREKLLVLLRKLSPIYQKASNQNQPISDDELSETERVRDEVSSILSTIKARETTMENVGVFAEAVERFNTRFDDESRKYEKYSICILIALGLVVLSSIIIAFIIVFETTNNVSDLAELIYFGLKRFSLVLLFSALIYALYKFYLLHRKAILKLEEKSIALELVKLSFLRFTDPNKLIDVIHTIKKMFFVHHTEDSEKEIFYKRYFNTLFRKFLKRMDSFIKTKK